MGLECSRKFAKILGEAIRCVGTERIIWGVDFVGMPWQYKAAVEGFRNFQFPEICRKDTDNPALTDDDRRKIFGANLGKLLGIDTTRRRVSQ